MALSPTTLAAVIAAGLPGPLGGQLAAAVALGTANNWLSSTVVATGAGNLGDGTPAGRGAVTGVLTAPASPVWLAAFTTAFASVGWVGPGLPAVLAALIVCGDYFVASAGVSGVWAGPPDIATGTGGVAPGGITCAVSEANYAAALASFGILGPKAPELIVALGRGYDASMAFATATLVIAGGTPFSPTTPASGQDASLVLI